MSAGIGCTKQRKHGGWSPPERDFIFLQKNKNEEVAASALLDKERDIAQLRNDVERAIREQQHGEYVWAALRQEAAGPLSGGISSFGSIFASGVHGFKDLLYHVPQAAHLHNCSCLS